jgi:hypothetical protein
LFRCQVTGTGYFSFDYILWHSVEFLGSKIDLTL